MGRLISRGTILLFGVALVLVAIFPVFWAVLNSLKNLLDIVTPTPRFFFTPTLDNYRQVISSPEVLTGLENSSVIVGTAVVLGTVLGVPAAYVIAAFACRPAATSSSSCCRCASCRRLRSRFR